MRPLFNKAPSFRAALKRARRIAAKVSNDRSFFRSDEMAEILGTCKGFPTALSKAGRLPAYRIDNDMALWPIAELINFLCCPQSWQANRPCGDSKPKRSTRLLRSLPPQEMAPSGTRTRLVLQLLKQRPMNTMELIALVGPRISGIIYRLRKRGHRIVSRWTFIVDDCGRPHSGVAIYELLEGGRHDY